MPLDAREQVLQKLVTEELDLRLADTDMFDAPLVGKPFEVWHGASQKQGRFVQVKALVERNPHVVRDVLEGVIEGWLHSAWRVRGGR